MPHHDPDGVPFTHGLHRVGDHCHAWLQPPGGFCLNNAGLVAVAGESLVVDTLVDLPRTRSMLAAMAAAEPAAQSVDWLVNTHGDPDHAAGNCLLPEAQRVMAVGAARQIEAFFQRGEPAAMPAEYMRLMAELGFDRFERPGPVHLPPTRTFQERLDLPLGGRTVHLVEFGPAHTRSDTVVHAPFDGVVYAGDLMFCRCHPVMGHGDVARWLGAFDAMLSWDADVFVPGHGPVCGRDEVQRHRDYVLFVEDEARRRHDAGMDVDTAALDIFEHLGRYDYLLRADILRKNVNVLYHHFEGRESTETFIDHSVARMRFRDRIRGRAPGIHVDHMPDGN